MVELFEKYFRLAGCHKMTLVRISLTIMLSALAGLAHSAPFISYSFNLNMLISAIYRVTRQSCWLRYGDCHRAHRPSSLPSLDHPSTFVSSAPTVGPTLVCESSPGIRSPPEKPLATPLYVPLLGCLSVSFASIVTAWASYLPPIANMADWAWKFRCLLYSVDPSTNVATTFTALTCPPFPWVTAIKIEGEKYESTPMKAETPSESSKDGSADKALAPDSRTAGMILAAA
ncbi:hypothetical protein KC326_g197 [Hortaea werneckii]|nr:hypothetical protein KC326_g197 [Hortaea werneckii]